MAESTFTAELTSKDQLKAFHRTKGIKYLVLDVDDLVDCLPLVDIPRLQNLLNAYAEYRQGKGERDSDLEWALRAMTGPGDLTFAPGAQPSEGFLRQVASCMSNHFSPQPETERDSKGRLHVVSMPGPEDAVAPDSPKISPYLVKLRRLPREGLQLVREAMSRRG